MSRNDPHAEPRAGATPAPLDYRPRRRPARPWAVPLRDAVLALAGFVAATSVSGVLHWYGGTMALGAGLGPYATAALTLAAGSAPLVVFELTGKGLDWRGPAAALLPAALVGWGLAALVEGVCFASMAG